MHACQEVPAARKGETEFGTHDHAVTAARTWRLAPGAMRRAGMV